VLDLLREGSDAPASGGRMKPPTPTEAKALEVFLRALRAAKRARNQCSVLIEWHAGQDGVDVSVWPNALGDCYRIECGTLTRE
jgi:hypothetical protein